jgi:hypothetical protein
MDRIQFGKCTTVSKATRFQFRDLSAFHATFPERLPNWCPKNVIRDLAGKCDPSTWKESHNLAVTGD